MAKSIRSRRISVAAGALSLALVAPVVAAPETASVSFLPAAAAQTVDDFSQRYTTGNFWDTKEAVVEGLVLEPGTTVAPTTNTIFNWKFRNDSGQLVLIRPQSSTAFRTGNVDIPVKVTPQGGKAFNTTLRVNVVDSQPTDPAEPAVAPAGVDKQKFDDRYDTANFWNKKEVAVEGLQLDPGTRVAPTTDTIFNWKFRNDNGTLVLIRPQSPIAFETGEVDIPVKVTEANGNTYRPTLKVNVVDSRTPKDWESQLDSEYTIDFGKSTAAKEVPGLTIPEGVTLSKDGLANPGWKLETRGGKVYVTPPAAFTEGSEKLSVTVNDGTDEFRATLRINARNPQTPPAQIAGTAADVLGKLLGGILGTGGGGGVLGSLLGGIGNLLGGGGGNGGDGGSTGSGAGRLINVVITNNANPTVNVEIKDNGSNNGSNNSAVVTGNANPVITGNANPTVEIKDNGSNNGSNNSAVVTGNANPNVEVKDNANNNGNPVITGNANPVITGNANPVITGNANPVITDNANSSLGSSNGGGGITSPRCIVALAGLGLPLAALVPIALAQQVRIPGLEQLAAQATEVFNNAAAQFNVQPEQITAVAGGAVGAVIALLAAVAVVSCIPGGAAPAAPAKPVETAAPVVETSRPA